MTNYRKLGVDIGTLVDEKQKAYGDSYGKSGGVLEVLYPDGVRVDQYPTFLAVTRVIDKLFRVATKKDAFGESPWRDIAGYALLGIAKDEKPVGVMGAQRIRSRELLDSLRAGPYDAAKDVEVPMTATEVLAGQEKLRTGGKEFEKGLRAYAREFVIPIEVPLTDADVDLMGLRIIRNDERCCDHPERGICHGEKTERIGPTAEDIEGVSR